MNKLFTFGGATLFGYVFWFIGQPLGFGWAFIISSIGSIIGVWAGWKLARKFEE